MGERLLGWLYSELVLGALSVAALESTDCYLGQGSTKWVSWVSKITEDPISYGNFSLEITYKMSKKGVFDRINFCHRIK